MEVSKKHQDALPRIKKNVEQSREYFEENYRNFHSDRNFVFNTTLTRENLDLLSALQLPKLEFNLIEPYVSRLVAEFSANEPSMVVSADDGDNVSPEVIECVEDHFRHIMFEASNEGVASRVYTDLLSGGFSVLEVWLEYAHYMSNKQVVKVGRSFDPTLCGFDPLAREPHLGDGRWAFKLYPKSKEEVKEEFPSANLQTLSFSKSIGGFTWNYNNGREDIVMLCEYYEKKKSRFKICELIDGRIMRLDDYKKFVENWEQSGQIAVAPGIVGKPRWTEKDIICRYIFIENQVLEYQETEYNMLPLVFVPGMAVDIRKSVYEDSLLLCKSYIRNVIGAQRLFNSAGQCLGNEFQNMIQHKFMACEESLPDQEEYLRAWKNVQVASTLIYRAFDKNDPSKGLPPPREIARVPIPTEIMNTFQFGPQLMQNILGSYDAALGVNSNQLSGVAIEAGANHSNATSKPYVDGFMKAWTRIGNICVDLFPKCYVTPRTVPVIEKDGTRGYKKIGKNTGLSFNYDENALQVKVDAGVNFSVQKSSALKQMVAMMQASSEFSNFMNSKGLPVILDNFEIRGEEELKELAKEYMAEQQQQKQQQMQMAQQQMQNNPQMMNAQTQRMKVMQDMQESTAKYQIEAAKVGISKQEADNDSAKVMMTAKGQHIDHEIAVDKAEAEKTRAAVDLAIKTIDMHHQHQQDTIKNI